jgi:predicted Zn-dependent protease
MISLSLTATGVAADHPRLEFALGCLAKSRGGALEAASRFEKARAADPLALPLVRLAVEARMGEGDRAAAVKLYRDLARARPDSLNIQITYSDFLTDQAHGDVLALKLANETLTAALPKFPGHPELIRRLFQQAQTAGDKTLQATLLDQLSSDEPTAVLLFAALARSLFDPDDPAARKKLDQRFLVATQSHPGNQGLARAASDHFRDTGHPEPAIEILKNHAAAAPWSLDLRTRLGVLYFTINRDQEGEAVLEEVLTIDPRQALAHQSLAKFHRLHGQSEPARFHASELLKIRGGSPAEFIKLADEWLAAGKPRESRLLLEKAVFDHPENRDLANRLAIATRRDPGTRAQAARLFREAEAARPAGEKSEPAFLIESAEALIEEGQTKAAEERLRTAIKTFPPEAKKETAAALRRLALLWESENRNPDAARALRQRADGLER